MKIFIKKEFNVNDRLSELPESLIFEILQFLPWTDVVRTTVLSKHWKNLWIAIPWLDFDSSMMKNKDKYRNFVCWALRCWRGTKMLRFRVKFDSEVEKTLTSYDIDRWVRFAVERGVKEMDLSLPYTHVYEVKKLYSVAQDLYSCSSLKELSLTDCNVQIHGKVRWDQLKSLGIYGVSLSEEAMDKVLCGSPRLESLTLFLEDNMASFSIRSGSLKRLEIFKFALRNRELTMEMRISTPNLEYLRFSGDSNIKCLLMNNMPLLSEAILNFHRQNVVGETLTQILPLIKHVERVFLSDLGVEVLGGMKEKHIVSSFPNANSLEIRVCRERHEQIVDILQMFPQLRHLLLNISCGSRLKEAKSSFKLEKNAENSLNFDTNNLPSSFIMKLRTIEVTCAKGDVSIIPLIQILLLKCASNLEKLVFLEQESWPRRILLKVQRSSPDEELIFDHTKFYICLQQLKDAA